MTEPAPKRLTLSKIVEDKLLDRQVDHSAVKLSKNARGETQIEVKVGTGENGIETVDQASQKAQEIYDALREKYH